MTMISNIVLLTNKTDENRVTEITSVRLKIE